MARLSTPRSLGGFEYLLLLALQRAATGLYGPLLRERLEAASEGRVSLGALYTTLARLERKGFVDASQSTTRRADRGRPATTHYTVTPVGRAALDRLEGARAVLLA